MQELILHIDYLLRRHDCVIVPGIGAFIASVRSASATSDGLLTPPARIIAFNPAISHNDGLLAASYSRRNHTDASEAARLLSADISALQTTLENGEHITVGDHGTLSADNDGTILFAPAEAPQWLPELRISSIIELARNDAEDSRADSALERGERIAVYLRRLKIAASVAVILAIGFIVSTPTGIDNAQFASPAVEQFKPKAPATERLLREPGLQSGTLLLNAVSDTTSVLTADTAAISAYKTALIRQAEASARKASEKKTENYGNYCLVVASLNNGEEAREFISANSSLPLHVLEKDGRFRVYAITGASIADVKTRAASTGLTDRFPGAWVCRR